MVLFWSFIYSAAILWFAKQSEENFERGFARTFRILFWLSLCAAWPRFVLWMFFVAGRHIG